MRIYPHTPLYNIHSERKPPKDLLQPFHYEPDGLSLENINRIVTDATRDQANWFLSDHADDNASFMAGFRRKGKQGPLWEYLEA